jgi:hypothetical protein
MTTYSGSCHCGTIRFLVNASPTHLSRCNCSICSAKGALYLPISEIASVEILDGRENLQSYRFNRKEAEHLFCRTCGIHPFHRPRMDPSRWSVNARCLDDGLPDLPIEEFDGKNWEEAAERERRGG